VDFGIFYNGNSLPATVVRAGFSVNIAHCRVSGSRFALFYWTCLA